MKILVLISLLLLAGCASSSKEREVEISFEKLRSFTVGKSLEKDFVTSFGSESQRSEKNGYYTLVYRDPETQNQRISVNFDKWTHILTSYLWIPIEGEREFGLERAKAAFPEADFKERMTSSENPHARVEIIAYEDFKTGALIRYNKTYQVVEAVGVYDIKSRLLSATRPAASIPYTIGDEF